MYKKLEGEGKVADKKWLVDATPSPPSTAEAP
jgi:hypothetical protein